MYYCVVSYKDKETNKWKLKWKTTKVLAKQGNIKKAKSTFPKIIDDFSKELEEKENKHRIEENSYEKRIEENKNKPFLTFIKDSLEEFKVRVAETTYDAWVDIVDNRITNFFSVFKELDKIVNEDVERPKYYERELKISEVTQFDIEDFYSWLYSCKLKGSTVDKYHVLFNLIFKRAIRLKVFTLESNPMKDIQKPTIVPCPAEYYTAKELAILLEIVRGSIIEMPVVLAAYYGIRRSNVIGLRWSAIDFENKFIKINHAVTKVKGCGENQGIHSKDYTKNQDILTLPLLPEVEEKLIEQKSKIEENKKFYGSAYIKLTEDYVCVNEIGELLKPQYVTHKFGDIIKANAEKLHHLKYHRSKTFDWHNVGTKQCKSGTNTSILAVTKVLKVQLFIFIRTIIPKYSAQALCQNN